MKTLISKFNEQRESVQVATIVAVLLTVGFMSVFFFGRTPVAISPRIMQQAISKKVDVAMTRYNDGITFGMSDAEAFEEIKETIEPDKMGNFDRFTISKGGLFSSFPQDPEFLKGYSRGLSELTGLRIQLSSRACGDTGFFGCDFKVNQDLLDLYWN